MTDIIGKRIPVLDRGWIELIDTMPHPSTGVSGDMAIINAARVSFLGESKGEEKDKKLLFRLFRDKHTSPFEMSVMTWRIHAPMITWWQWIRHRMASYSGQSGRYTEFKEDQFYVPDEWRLQSSSNKQASDGKVTETINRILTDRLMTRYEQAWEDYTGALNLGIAREQARLFLLGFGVYYTFMVKMDVHNALHFLKLRMAEDAQFEIRTYAKVMYEETFKPLLPWTAEAFEMYALNKE